MFRYCIMLQKCLIIKESYICIDVCGADSLCFCVCYFLQLLFVFLHVFLDSLGMDGLQPLSSDSATLAMQQAMLGGTDDSMDGTEEDDEEEEEEEGIDEEEDEEEDEESEGGRQMARRDLGLNHNEGLE